MDTGLCPACQFFGATGQAKAFGLSLGQTKMALQHPYGLKDDVVRSRRAEKDGQSARYHFPEGLLGQARLSVLPRRPDDTTTPKLVLGLLEFIRRYAALGAKTNLGYGLSEWVASPSELGQASGLSKQGDVGQPLGLTTVLDGRICGRMFLPRHGCQESIRQSRSPGWKVESRDRRKASGAGRHCIAALGDYPQVPRVLGKG